MKINMKLGICSALLVSSFVCGTLTADGMAAEASGNDVNVKAAQQVVSQFKDVNKSNYAYDAINWAKKEGIIDGFNDGTFKPNATITEAQFAKMLAEFMGIKDDNGDLLKNKYTASSHWSDSYYDALASYGVPLNSYFDNGLRNKPVKRGVVAQAISYMTGNATTLTDSIYFMIDEGVTVGQNPQFQGKDLNKYFGSQNNLTRAQVAAFLYRMHNVDIEEATGIALVAHRNDEGLSLVGLANKGMSKLDNSLRLGKLGSEKPSVKPPVDNNGGNTKPPVKPPVENNGDFSNAKLPVSDSASSKDVDVNELNKVASLLSSGTVDKFKENGYEITHASKNMVYTNKFILVVDNTNASVKYGFKYNKGVDNSFIKSVVKDLSGVTLTDADLSSRKLVEKGKVHLEPDNGGGKTINIHR